MPVEPREYIQACEWIGQFATALTTADALHLATAFHHNLRIVTADRALALGAKHFGVDHEPLAH